MQESEVKVIVRCPKCEWRIFDKVTPTTGVVEVKCPHCRKVVTVDLALRRKAGLKYRLLVRSI